MRLLSKLPLFLVPVILPLLILTSLSVYLAMNDVKKDSVKYNLGLLKQTRESIELMLAELDTLSYSFDSNQDIAHHLRGIFDRYSHTYASNLVLNTSTSFLNAYTYTKPYIHSIYIYYENQNQHFLTLTDGIVRMDEYVDTAWLDMLTPDSAGAPVYLSQARSISATDVNRDTPVITIVKRFFASSGGIVLNLHPRYLEPVMFHSESPDQRLFLFNEQQQLLFSRSQGEELAAVQADSLTDLPEFFRLHSPNGDFAVFTIQSDKYGWIYVSMLPWHTFYQIPDKIVTTTLILSGTMLLIGTALTTYLIRRDHTRTDLERRYLKAQLSERRYKAQAMELLVLRSQINPHFLYNTLETMNWKAIRLTDGPNELNQMIDHLSQILHYSLDSRAEQISIAQEIQHTYSYIDIQKQRYKDKFDVIWEYDKHNLQDALVPKLLLQPLVENALYHGLKEKYGGGKTGYIKVKLYAEQFMSPGTDTLCLRIIVIDNGIGIPADKLALLQKLMYESEEPSRHIGLVNTARRLKLLYGEGYGLTVRSKLHRGTVITITLPLLKAEEPVEV